MSHTLLYIESHMMCILLLGILFVLHMKHWRPRYINPLSVIYLLTMQASVLDIIWILLDGTNRFVWLYHIVNIVYLSSFEFVGYFWLEHCSKAFSFRLWKNTRQKCLYILPAAAISLMIALSAFTGSIYGIDANGVYYRGKYFFIQSLAYLYFVAVSVLAIYAMRRAKHISEKRKYAIMAIFPLPSLLMSFLQLLMPPGSLPTIQFSITFALLIYFITFLESNVTQDSLTGLSNRYALDRTLDAKMNSRKNRPDELYVIMGDLDKFKSINDTYGHMEGDRALKTAANILKEIFHNTPAVLARMGGDEFAIILESEVPVNVHVISAEINRRLAAASRGEAYSLAMSLGMARYIGQKTATEFLKEADRALYRAKKTRDTR